MASSPPERSSPSAATAARYTHLSAAARRRLSLIISTFGVTALLIVGLLLTLRFADGFTQTIIGILVSVLVPPLGAMFTQLVVSPLRAIAVTTEQTSQDVGQVKAILVNGHVSSLGDELRTSIAANALLVEQIRALQSGEPMPSAPAAKE